MQDPRLKTSGKVKSSSPKQKTQVKRLSLVKASTSVKTSADTSADKQKNNDKTGEVKSSVKLEEELTNPVKEFRQSNSNEPQTMDELIAQTNYSFKSWKRGEFITGVINSVSPKHVVIDIGGKSEAVVHEKELPYVSDILSELKAGDKIEVYVVNPENDRGQTVVSLRKTAVVRRWENLTEKVKSGDNVSVTIRDLSKGGFLIDYMGLRGFIPMSQVDPELMRLGEKAWGRKIQAKIIEADKATNRLVLSQLAGNMSDKQKDALAKAKVGEVYKCQVTGIAPFGAFVNVHVTSEAPLPGLAHISEIAWEKVENVTDYLKQGQIIDLKVVGIDTKMGKLTLSLKQLTPDPWQDVPKMLTIEQTVKGKVTRTTDYGVFVQFLPGIEGLIHISKLTPGEEPKTGAEIECTIEEINPDKRKISLSLITHAKPIGYR